MEEEEAERDRERLPLKRVEVSLSKFNDVAIPHHLDLLRQHRANILKLEESGEWSRVVSEQARARRVATQLRALLHELWALRGRVRAADRARFDALTQRARDRTLAAIVDYLGTCPVSVDRDAAEGGRGVCGSAVSTESVGVVRDPPAPHTSPDHPEPVDPTTHIPPTLQLQVDTREGDVAELHAREEVLRGWSALQREVGALHDAWRLVHAAALAQKEQVAASAGSVESAAGEVGAGAEHLAAAHRMSRSGVLWCGGGAALGALAGGPVGLVVGAKAGAAALLAGSLLGYWGGRLLARASRTHAEHAASTQHVKTE